MRALVVGAGISGLAAARRLRREGLEVEVLEAAERPGGTLSTLRRDGFVAELGPNTVFRTPELVELCRDAGCEQRLIDARPSARRRWVVADGRLEPLPLAPPALLKSSLLPPLAKLRLAAEPFVGSGPGPHETVADFLTRRLGRRALERLGDAMVLGIYAGDPHELAVGHAFPRMYRLEREHGSLVRGALAARRRPGPRRRLVAHDAGFASLAEDLAEGLRVRYASRVEALHVEQGGFTVESSQGESVTAERLVMALPQQASLELLAPLFAELGRAPEPLPSAPVAVVTLGYPIERVAHPLDGFGFLAPHGEGRSILGCLFPSSLFPGRAPRGCALLTVMVGGRRRPELVSEDDATLVRLAGEELGELLGARGEPVLAAVERWIPGIPQPTAAQAALRTAVATLEARHPGLDVLGSWREGVSVPDCLAAGWGLGEETS